MSRVVVCDLDGVLVDFNSSARAFFLERGASMREFETGDPDRWNYMEAYGATPDMVKEFWGYVTDHPEWWAKLGKHRDFDDALPVLAEVEDTAELYFMTSRPKGARDASVRWLQRNACIAHPQVIITPHDKTGALKSLRPDFVIEDNLGTLAQFQSERMGKLILVERTYNRGIAAGKFVNARTTRTALELCV